ncbi:hypothetical protein H310_07638 [Aphanomyces invadans]|uniref:RRM domain-containing protein n=1 Tax=Aphanomyces invadans TaxID=157072 RepID=A0A024U1W4_9STRA|nr:hypothetical protein H310_07638 [Aphanomyces invadans]ETW00249.1 hypothetical protein H310_07638 [Aphanomyces invadans]|eukprot:XP_008871274.1 hypothetical protein H310_07638 [Aphanomyces invadans]
MTDCSPKIGKIFIGGLSYETTDEKLRSYFGAYGTVTDAVVMKDPISRRSRGFGFITYADPSCVDRALAQPNHVLDSRRVEAKRAVPRAESARDTSSATSSRGGPPSASSSSGGMPGSLNSSGVGSGAATKKIFVGGLHYETKDAEFKKYFSQYGKVVSAEVMFNRETNKSRGFGFVIFESEHSVDLVLQDCGHVLDGKSVEVKRAVPRTDAPPGAPSGPATTRTHLGSSTRGSFSDDLSSTPKHLLSPRSNPPVSPASRCSPSLAPVAGASSSTFGGYAAAVRYGGGRVTSLPSSSPVPCGLDASLDQLHIDSAHLLQHPQHLAHRQSPDQSRLFRSHDGGSTPAYPPPYLSQHDYVDQSIPPQWQSRHQQPQPWQQHHQQHHPQQGWSTENHPTPGLRQPSEHSRHATVFGMFTPHQPTAASSNPPPRWDSSYGSSDGFQFGLGGFAGRAGMSSDGFEYGARPPTSSSLVGLGIEGEDDLPLRFGDPSYLGIDQDVDDRPQPPPSTNGPTPQYLYRHSEDDSDSGRYYPQYR